MEPTPLIDVLIVGGGAAGLSAALALGRSRRSVVVVDAGQPRNAPAAHMQGVLGHDGLGPAEFLALGRRDLEPYGVEVVSGTAEAARRLDDGTFAITLGDGSVRLARRILVATGVTDVLPEITNLAARWGRDVIHCPYCHGWEVRDTKTAVISTGPMGVHGALLFRQWSNDVTLFVHTGAEPTPDETERLRARGIAVVRGVVAEVRVEDDRVTGVTLASGETTPVETVMTASRLLAHSPVLTSLGLEPVPHFLGTEVGMHFVATPTGQTDIDGVWAAGNVVDPFATVPAAVAAGYLAGAHLNADLVTADTDAAVAAAPAWDQAYWDERYGVADRIWSGNPNPQLVADVAALPAGRALDVGAGEGADAIWLAEQGWTVDAVDISPVALARGQAEAEARGATIAERITWTTVDALTDDFPGTGYDLVTAQFMHFRAEDRAVFFDRCMAAVAPGGTLQIVAHHRSMLDQAPAGHSVMAGMFYDAEEVADRLDDTWTVVACDSRTRTAAGPDGAPRELADAVLVARRNADV